MSNSPIRPLSIAALPFASACATARLPPFAAIAERLVEAARGGASLAVFPEMSLAGAARLERLRRTELEALSEPLDGPSVEAVARAVEMTGVAAGAGWIERAHDGALYNSYVVCMPGGARHVHRKVYAMESPHMQSGGRFDVFDTPWGVTMSILIGADNYLPENARVAALRGATLLIAPHRSVFGAGADACPRPDGFSQAIRARASDNGMFAVLSDVQAEPMGRCTAGVALIADPAGAVIAAAKPPRCPMAIASIDPKLARQSAARRWLAVRRPELYGSLAARRSGEHDDPPAWEGREPAATARGSVAVSFAIVGRKRPIR